MIDRRIGKIKIRRGTDLQRANIVFPEGELLYTTDKKRVYIGDGSTTGGIIISNKNYIVAQLDPLPYNAIFGDIIFNKVDSTTYIVGSADNGSLSALLISDPNCCIQLKAQIDLLKTRINEISACVNAITPPQPPTGQLVFVVQPVSVSVNVGETAVFTVSAIGAGTITYQWYKADTDTAIAGALGNTFTIPSVQISDSIYYYCVAHSSVLGDLKSNRAALIVGGNSILADPNGEYILSDPDGGYIDWN